MFKEKTEYFDDNNTPFSYFGKRFFDQWDKAEYNQFYNTMILATQYYLKHGLVEPVLGRYYYILKNSAPRGFIGKCDLYLGLNERYNKAELLVEYKKDLPILESMSQYTFTSLLKKYADYKGWNVEEPHSGDISSIIFTSRDIPERQE